MIYQPCIIAIAATASVVWILAGGASRPQPSAGLPAPVPAGAFPVTAIGIVRGLKGTGDGDYQPLRVVLHAVYPDRSFTLDELRGFAVVSVAGDVPVPVRVGGPVTVRAYSIGCASSLEGAS